MEICYDVPRKTVKKIHMGGGCYTKCEVNTNFGADYYCCERIKSA